MPLSAEKYVKQNAIIIEDIKLPYSSALKGKILKDKKALLESRRNEVSFIVSQACRAEEALSKVLNYHSNE
jgi:hypothetical protein